MKTKKLRKKLDLRKVTVSNLQQKAIKGGVTIPTTPETAVTITCALNCTGGDLCTNNACTATPCDTCNGCTTVPPLC